MKNYYKNVNSYYILVPLVVIFWCVFARGVLLPGANKKYDKILQDYTKSQPYFTEILKADPDRLKYQQKAGSEEFDYADVVDIFAKKFKIPSSTCDLRARGEVKRGGGRTKSADVSINPIDVETLALFISEMMLEWPKLQCGRLTLKKLKSGPDQWDVDIKFTYYY